MNDTAPFVTSTQLNLRSPASTDCQVITAFRLNIGDNIQSAMTIPHTSWAYPQYYR